MSVSLHQGDCLVTLRGMADNSVDSIVTDPPYGLSFMGKKWDYDVPSVDIWAECLRVLKPGGHLLAFAGTRTQHRMAVRIEDAGFEIRDMIAWVYGCLDEATEVATEKGVMPYHKTKVGDRVLCYDVAHGEYTYQPILEIVEYDYSDTAYRLVGDFGEQVVSRNHRVIAECGGSESFNLAETLGAEARVPVLESLPALQQAVHDAQQVASRTEQDVQQSVCKCTDRTSAQRGDPPGAPQGQNDKVLGLRGGSLEAERLASEKSYADVQPGVQWRDARCGVGEARTQRSGALVGRVGSGAEGAHDGRVQPGMEGRVDVSQPEGGLRRSADQVRAMPCGSDEHGSGGRLCHGASSCGGAGSWEVADASGVRASHQPRCDGQSAGEPDAVRHERTAQGIRAWGGHRSAVVRVVPFHYTGKVWCLRVPTGAFVAVRNGVAFPTGNSGFPKSLDVSKALDKAAGAEREVIGMGNGGMVRVNKRNAELGYRGADYAEAHANNITAPATDAARQWQGWGTALKPALEPITVARKPLIGTVAGNVLTHGTGALNIDGCRVGWPDGKVPEIGTPGWGGPAKKLTAVPGQEGETVERSQPNSAGRWPANLIHDGSDEVVVGFPMAKGQQGALTGKEPSSKTSNTFGDYGGRNPSEPRGDVGSAARFFYCAKASKADREEGLDGAPDRVLAMSNQAKAELARGNMHEGESGMNTAKVRKNNHPTVKPTDLMAYLCRMVTPPGGVVLDPFMGSGSTGKAALREGFGFIGCEMSPEYTAIARARIEAALAELYV